MKSITRIIGLVLLFATTSFAWAGQGTITDPCATEISSASQLLTALNRGYGNYRLTADIDLSSYSGALWTASGSTFNGTLDGGGHTITSLTITKYDQSSYQGCGLVRALGPCGVIENLHFETPVIAAYAIAGTVCGYNLGTIRNVTINTFSSAFTTIQTPSMVLAGSISLTFYNSDGTTFNQSVSLPDDGCYVGGIAGFCEIGSLVEGCSVKDLNINGAGYYTGGITGYSQGTIQRSNTANVSLNWGYMTFSYDANYGYYRATSYTASMNNALAVGGIAGAQDGGIIQHCYVLCVPDFAHYSDGFSSDANWFVGYNYIGGFVGVLYSGTLTECGLFGGGFAGSTYANTRGTIAGWDPSASYGWTVGYNDAGTVTNCYYEHATASKTYAQFISGLTSDLPGWSTSAWSFANGRYPTIIDITAPTYNFTVATSSSCQPATLSLSGTPPTGDCVQYQWQWSTDNSNWTNIDGATSATYTTSVSETADIYYRCRVLYDGYSYLPTNTSVVVHPSPVITLPANYNICSGGSTTLGASATNATTYSWSPSTGLSATNVAQPTASPTVTTIYTLTAENTYCSANKNTTVAVAHTEITSQPSDAVVCYGETDDLSVTATGAGTVTYAWKYSSDNGVNWADASGTNNAAIYAIPINLAVDGNHKFKVVVNSDCGDAVTSDVVTVTVNPATAITSQPGDATVYYGETTNLSVTATGAGLLTYTWQYSSNNGASWSNASGTNNAVTYTIPTNLTIGGNHKFRVLVHNDCGDDVISNAATITVLPLLRFSEDPCATPISTVEELKAALASGDGSYYLENDLWLDG